MTRYHLLQQILAIHERRLERARLAGENEDTLDQLELCVLIARLSLVSEEELRIG